MHAESRAPYDIAHRGSKAELYAAASAIELAIADLGGQDEVASRYVDTLLDRWEQGENAAEAALLRAAPTHPDGAANVQAIFNDQILPACRAAFPDDPTVEQRAALLLSQTLGVVYSRYLLQLEPIASMDLDVLRDAITRAVHNHLTGPLG